MGSFISKWGMLKIAPLGGIGWSFVEIARSSVDRAFQGCYIMTFGSMNGL